MSAHNRKLADLVLDLGGNEFQIQCRKAEIVNNTDDGEFFPTFDSTDGGFVEAADAAFALDLEFYADWRSAGVSDWLWDNDGSTVPFQVTHHPDIPAETVIFTGEVLIKAPNVGGEVRTTEVTAVTLICNGKPAKTRP
jgi:hypothetical protein